MVTISCPLCCNETFTSHAALRIHILSILDTIFCPSCNTKFNSLSELVTHLESACKDTKFKKTEIVFKREIEDAPDEPEEPCEENQEEEEEDLESILAGRPSKQEVQETPENAEGAEDEVYFCQMCSVQFSDIESHLKEFHEGEEVLFEEEEEEEEEEEGDNEETSSQNDISEENTVFIVNSDEIHDEEAETEPEYTTPGESSQEIIDRDREGRLYTRKFVKIDKFWLQSDQKDPLIQKYIVENGDVKKISDSESEKISDKNSIIEISQCPDCNTLFPVIDMYKQHQCAQQLKDKLKCKLCNVILATQQDLIQHNTKFHVKKQPKKTIAPAETGPFECAHCSTDFPTFKSLRLHRRMHEPVKAREIEAPVNYGITESVSDVYEPATREMFVCEICNKTYDKQYEAIHLKSHNSDEHNGYNCEVCNRKFFTESNLEMHMKAHTNNKKFACSYCKKPFVTYDSLNEHLSNGCQKRPYACQFCGRRFARPHEKVKHERIHTGEKPHVCDICGKSFRVSYCLTLHLRTHSGSRPYHCRECGKRFKSHSVYNHHLLTHSDIRNYKCPYCPKAFKTSVQLAGHKNSHTKPFSCTECNRPFASLYAVRAHMESHKRENSLKFDCYICGALYSRAFALRDHMKQQHPEVEEEGKEKSVEMTVEEEIDATNSILVKEDDMILGLDGTPGSKIEIIENETVVG